MFRKFINWTYTFSQMKPHLPLLLLAALSQYFTGTTQAAPAPLPTGNLGNVMYIGDSITHGVNSASYRWALHKIFADNGIGQTAVGVKTGNYSGGVAAGTNYGGVVFNNVHSAQSSANSYHIAGVDRNKRPDNSASNFFGGSNIKNWLGLSSTTTTNQTYTGPTFTQENGNVPNTFFMMIGTNDTLSNYGTGFGGNGHLAEAQKQMLGTKTGASWSNTGDFDTIINAMREANADANIILTTIPCWMDGRNNNNTAADFAAITSYNKALADWAAWKSITLVDVNMGMIDVARTDKPGVGVASMFGGDRLHPSAQGDLIIAGNIAKSLGYAGRSAGQVRKAAASFAAQSAGVYANATHSGVSQSGSNLTLSHDGTLNYTWSTGTDTSHGFTMDFSVALGNGAEGGWNTSNNLSLTFGSGSHSGQLLINEAYIQWGNTVLYSTDMSANTEALRVAYIYGNNEKGLASGYYVWLGDMLIGEALADGGASVNGLTITNGTGSSVTIGNLALDATGSWAPTSTGLIQNGLIIPPLQQGSALGTGTISWVAEADCDVFKAPATISGNIRNTIDNTTGAEGKVVAGVVTSGNAGNGFQVNSGNYTGDVWVTLTGSTTVDPKKFNGLHTGGTLTGNAYLRMVDLTSDAQWGAIFGAVNGTKVMGNLYLEFSSADTVYSGGTFSSVHTSVAGAYQTSVDGTITMVFNTGVFEKNIYGGSINGSTTIGATDIFVNAGLFKGSIFAGGTVGSITGSTSITITGNEAVVHNGAAWGEINAAGVAIGGASTVTIKDLTAGEKEFGFDKFAGKLSGGANVTGTKTLVFDNTQLDVFHAQLADFDKVELKNNSDLSLGALGGATELVVGEGSRLELTDSSYDLKVSNSGTIAVKSGTILNVTDAGDVNLAGVFRVEGGTLNMNSLNSGNAIEVTSGTVQGANNSFSGTIRINASGPVSMNDASGSNIRELNTSTATTVTGIKGDVTVENSTLTMGMSSLNNAVLGIEGALTVTNDLTLQIDADLLQYLKELNNGSKDLSDGSHQVTLKVTSGTLNVQGTVQLTQTVGVTIQNPTDNTDGTVSFSCNTSNIFLATDTGGTINDYKAGGLMDTTNGTSSFISTQVNEDLTVSLPGAAPNGMKDGLIFNNLEGGQSLTISNTADNGSKATVTLNNQQFDGNTSNDSSFLGNLQAARTNVVKTGEGTLTLGGSISITEGSLSVNEGKLEISQQNGTHQISELSLGTNGTLDLLNGSNVTVGSSLTLQAGTLTSTDQAGHLTLDGNTLTIQDNASVSGIHVHLQNGASLVLGKDISLSALTGEQASMLSGSNKLDLSGGQGIFEGSLNSYQGTIALADGAEQTLKGSGGDNATLNVDGAGLTLAFGDAGATYKRLELGTPPVLTNRVLSASSNTAAHVLNIDMTGTAGGTLTLTNGAVFGADSIINVSLPKSYAGASLLATGPGSTIDFQGETTLKVNLSGALEAVRANGIKIGEKGQFQNLNNLHIQLVGYTGSVVEQNGELIIIVHRKEGFTYAAFGTTGNAAAAGKLFDFAGDLWPSTGTLGSLTATVEDLILNGRTQEASKLMASAAGTTVTSLGAAQRTSMRDQMGYIRNRLVNTGVDDTVHNEELPYFHLWAQATGSYAELNGGNDESGFTLNSWGGTVGFDVDAGEHVNIGLAVTASYGDLDAEGAERASGDFDTWFVNLFSKIKVKRWTHKAIATLGLTDAELNRTVALGNTNYRTEGSTNGTSYGFMYELTYDTYMNEDETAILQPLLNLSIVNGRIDGYTETGSAGNAALRVGKQTMTTGTIALGARVMGELSTNVLGRASFGEFRVNLAQDMGDNRSQADVAFTGAPGATATMRSAKAGTTGVQIGAGLSVPLEEHSSIYFDVNADFRSHASSVNGSVGYRYDF